MADLSRTFVLRTQSNAAALYAFLRANWQAMAASEHPLSVTVAEYKERRSRAQNDRLWALLTTIGEQVWIEGRQYAPEVWHEHMKWAFAPKEDGPTGLIAMSTSRMDVEQFSKYMLEIETFAMSEYGVEFSL